MRPSAKLKEILRTVLPAPLVNYRRRIVHAPLIAEIAKLDIRDCGVQRDLSYIRLADGMILYGPFLGDEFRSLYQSLRKHLNPVLTEETFELAIHAIRHYVFPVSIPVWTPPYSRRARRFFGRYAQDTIVDMPGMTNAEKRTVKQVFIPREGTLFIDCGSWLGYGPLRVRHLIGQNGRMVVFEADKGNFAILRRNLDTNSCTNVITLQKAVWSSRGQIKFLAGVASASMVAAMKGMNPTAEVDGFHEVVVETETVDEAIGDMPYDHNHILINVTVNGAELEAIRGMERLLSSKKSIALNTIAYKISTYERMKPILESFGLQVVRGRLGRVLAWK